MRLRVAVPLAGFLALAGCLGADIPQAMDPLDGLAAIAMDYVCPPGETGTTAQGLCVRSLWDPGETYEEPYLAVHPSRPEILVLGVNARHAEPRLGLGPQGPFSEQGRMQVFVTEDAGATWRAADPPPIFFGDAEAALLHGSFDPALAFDAAGLLHVTQLNVGLSGPFWFDIQYARSADLGRTWSEPLLLAADGDNDRNWLAVGPDGTLFATWRNVLREPLPPEVAWSRDGGTTWSEPTAPEGCTTGATPLPVEGGGLLMACTLHEQGVPTGLAVHHLDLATGTWTLRSTAPTPPGWRAANPLYPVWDGRADGTVVLLARQANHGFLTVSRDGARSWEEARPLADLCACDGAERLVAYGAAFDPWGGFHALFRDGYLGTPDAPNEDNARYARHDLSTWHVVLDPRTGATVQERTLLGPGAENARVPPPAAPPIGRDDYYVPAFWEGGGALAWTRDRGIDLTFLQPSFGP